MELTYRESIVWAAAFLEGEGTVGAYPSKSPNSFHFKLSCGQKQRWPLERLQLLFKAGTITDKAQKTRDYYNWQVSGPNARGIMMMIYPFMSPRRQEQIKKALSFPWRQKRKV